jgi:hypothetical protein
MNQLMRGNTPLRGYIASFLSTEMPELLKVARDQWNLNEETLPNPKKYDSTDPMSANVYPVVGSYVTRTSDWTRTNISAAAEQEYSATYHVEMFIWAQTPILKNGEWVTPIYDEALRCRDDLMAVMRSCLLRTPSLRSNGYCRLDEGTLTETYLPGIKGASNASWLAGATISVDMNVDESNYLAPIGTVQETEEEVKLTRRGEPHA